MGLPSYLKEQPLPLLQDSPSWDSLPSSTMNLREYVSNAAIEGNPFEALDRLASARARAAAARRLREFRKRLQAVRLEQLLELRGGFLRGLDQLRLVVTHGVLHVDLSLVVLLEKRHGTLGSGDAKA